MKKGTVVFQLSNVGSKSEGVLPYLYENNGVFTRIYANDDDPFSNEKLRQFDGRYVHAEGETNRHGVFCISDIAVESQENEKD